jgi:2'-5' RNA ligase
MHGLVSLLPEPFYARVASIWQELARDFGLVGIQVTPYPHFSWQIAEDYDLERLEALTQEIAAQAAPFVVHTAGLALFTGEKPVIYIPVVKTARLLAFHAQVWERTEKVSSGRSVYYAPESWMPHISLAYEDVEREKIGRVMERLAFQTFNWEIIVDNIALIYEPTGEIGKLRFKYPFTSSLIAV